MNKYNIDNEIIDLIRKRLKKPVVFIGLMGAGKTRLGRMLSDVLDLSFADSDSEIEKAAGMAISDIFELYGEKHFRDGEHRVIKRLLEEAIGVMATGGGAVMTPATADLVWGEAISIWIKASLPVTLERTSRNDRRPLLQLGNAGEILSDLMEKRYPVYEKADIVIDSDEGAAHIVLKDLIDKLDIYLSAQN